MNNVSSLLNRAFSYAVVVTLSKCYVVWSYSSAVRKKRAAVSSVVRAEAFDTEVSSVRGFLAVR